DGTSIHMHPCAGLIFVWHLRDKNPARKTNYPRQCDGNPFIACGALEIAEDLGDQFMHENRPPTETGSEVSFRNNYNIPRQNIHISRYVAGFEQIVDAYPKLLLYTIHRSDNHCAIPCRIIGKPTNENH